MGNFAPPGLVDLKFHVEGDAPANHCFPQKTSVNDLSFCIKIWTDFSSVWSQSMRFTDGRTDGRTDVQTYGRADTFLVSDYYYYYYYYMYLITLHTLSGGRNELWERRQSSDQFMTASS